MPSSPMFAMNCLSKVSMCSISATDFSGVNNTYVLFTPLKSVAEIEHMLTLDKQFMANMGEDGMKKLSELAARAIETSQSSLFSFNPKMSYVTPEWIKADPDFWKPKVSAAAAP